jgi:hypothetical protein
MQVAGGRLNDATSSADYCSFCPASGADAVLGSLRMGTDKSRAWRNLGLMNVYVVVNILATFAIYFIARLPLKPKLRGGLA